MYYLYIIKDQNSEIEDIHFTNKLHPHNKHSIPIKPSSSLDSVVYKCENLHFPIDWYLQRTRPDYIKLIDVDKFQLVEPEYKHDVDMTFDHEKSVLILKYSQYRNIATIKNKVEYYTDKDIKSIKLTKDIRDLTKVSPSPSVKCSIFNIDIVVNDNRLIEIAYDANFLSDEYYGVKFICDGETITKDLKFDLGVDVKNLRRIRYERKNLIEQTDIIAMRYSEQQQLNIPNKSLTEEEYQQLLVYRQELRDMPQNYEKTKKVDMPQKPKFLK